MNGADTSMLLLRPEDFQEALATLQLPTKIKTLPMFEPPVCPIICHS